MFFKKYKVKKTHTTPKIIPYAFGVIGVFLIFSLGVKAINVVNNIEFDFAEFTPNYVSQDGENFKSIEAKKDDILSVLILGRGGGNHDAPDLTDTIILASMDFKKDIITLLSIPRDLYVKYPADKRTGKINRVYETYRPLGKDIAIDKIKSKVTEITGQNIDYYVNVDFEGFTEIIDILGGVEVTLEENFVDYKYPDGNLGYTTFVLRKGTWTLDGETALKYARSRHSTSDFDRSLRQQQILSSLKQKALSLGYFKDNKKVRQLYGALQEYVETDIDISTLLKLAVDFKTGGDKNILSFNLNDSCFEGSPVCSAGGFLYVPLREMFGGQSVLLVEGSNINSLSNYETLDTYNSLIFKEQEIYTQPRSIRIYNATQKKFLAGSLAETLKKYGIPIPEDGGVGNITEKKFEKSILYYNGIDSDDMTLGFLERTLGFESQKTDTPLYGDESANIEIVLGEDFKEIEYLETLK